MLSFPYKYTDPGTGDVVPDGSAKHHYLWNALCTLVVYQIANPGIGHVQVRCTSDMMTLGYDLSTAFSFM
jgi:hypothetical protein